MEFVSAHQLERISKRHRCQGKITKYYKKKQTTKGTKAVSAIKLKKQGGWGNKGKK